MPTASSCEPRPHTHRHPSPTDTCLRVSAWRRWPLLPAASASACATMRAGPCHCCASAPPEARAPPPPWSPAAACCPSATAPPPRWWRPTSLLSTPPGRPAPPPTSCSTVTTAHCWRLAGGVPGKEGKRRALRGRWWLQDTAPCPTGPRACSRAPPRLAGPSPGRPARRPSWLLPGLVGQPPPHRSPPLQAALRPRPRPAAHGHHGPHHGAERYHPGLPQKVHAGVPGACGGGAAAAQVHSAHCHVRVRAVGGHGEGPLVAGPSAAGERHAARWALRLEHPGCKACSTCPAARVALWGAAAGLGPAASSCRPS